MKKKTYSKPVMYVYESKPVSLLQGSIIIYDEEADEYEVY